VLSSHLFFLIHTVPFNTSLIFNSIKGFVCQPVCIAASSTFLLPACSLSPHRFPSPRTRTTCEPCDTLHGGTTLQPRDHRLRARGVRQAAASGPGLVFREDPAKQRGHMDPNTPTAGLPAKAALFCAREPASPAWTSRFRRSSHVPGDAAARGRNGTELWEMFVVMLQRRDSWIPSKCFNSCFTQQPARRPKTPYFCFICLLSNMVLARYINKHII